ncbi:MAG: hypothetical protein JJE53_03470 [Candidatus Pacebacteria bacterium]|nr:hypothetical protein [Candidatus Paceibacterota bacterium]
MLYTLLCILVIIIILRLLGISIFSVVAFSIIGIIVLIAIILGVLGIIYFSGELIAIGIIALIAYTLLYFGERKDKDFFKKYITGGVDKNKKI